MSVEEWIAQYAAAWRAKDIAGVTELFTEDGVYRSSPTGAAHVGTDAIAAYWRSATSTQENLDLRFGRPIVEGSRASVEWWAVMRDPDWRCQELREYYNPVFGQSITAPEGWGE